jgi:hypothetical protein
LALGKGLFAGPAMSCGLCRGLPLGTGCAESIRACAERSLLSAKPQIPVVYVNDLIITGNDEAEITKFKKHMCAHFQMSDLGLLCF